MSELILWKNQEISKLKRDIDRLFDRFWSDFGVRGLCLEFSKGIETHISETEHSLVIRMLLPGIDPEALDISVTGDTVFISGEKKKRDTESASYYRKVERMFGSFSRTIKLPCKVKVDKIEATYKDGILSVFMPKKEPEESRETKIEIR